MEIVYGKQRVSTEEARQFSKQIGAIVHWAPDGDTGPNSWAIVSHYRPEPRQ